MRNSCTRASIELSCPPWSSISWLLSWLSWQGKVRSWTREATFCLLSSTRLIKSSKLWQRKQFQCLRVYVDHDMSLKCPYFGQKQGVVCTLWSAKTIPFRQLSWLSSKGMSLSNCWFLGYILVLKNPWPLRTVEEEMATFSWRHLLYSGVLLHLQQVSTYI